MQAYELAAVKHCVAEHPTVDKGSALEGGDNAKE